MADECIATVSSSPAALLIEGVPPIEGNRLTTTETCGSEGSVVLAERDSREPGRLTFRGLLTVLQGSSQETRLSTFSVPREMLAHVTRRLGAPERAVVASLPDLDGDGRPETLRLLSQPLVVRETEYSSVRLVPIPLEGGQELYSGSYCREVTAEGGIVGIVIMSDPNAADFQIVTLRTKTSFSACVGSLLSSPPPPRPATPQSASTPPIPI